MVISHRCPYMLNTVGDGESNYDVFRGVSIAVGKM